MKKKLIVILTIMSSVAVFALSFGCSNRDAAQLGAMIGRTLGKPIGTAATAVDETFRTVGDVMTENPRHQNRKVVPVTVAREEEAQTDDQAYFYRTEVLVKTRGPAQIESLQLQQSEDVSEFWRDYHDVDGEH